MLRSLKDLQGYSIHARDGDLGSVDQFFFDDERWTVRYLVVDTGGWLPGRLVLISPIAVERADWDRRHINLSITKAQVEHSPGIDADQPVSRQFEADYYAYYGWPYYWAGGAAWGAYAYPGLLAAPPPAQQPATEAEADQDQQDRGDPHLRASKEVIGYHIRATDDAIGHVEDFVVDDGSWDLRYLVVDTSNWWFGKKVLVAPPWVTQVSWEEREVMLDLSAEQIKNGPEWDPTAPINRAYEERLYDAYGRPAYWV